MRSGRECLLFWQANRVAPCQEKVLAMMFSGLLQFYGCNAYETHSRSFVA